MTFQCSRTLVWCLLVGSLIPRFSSFAPRIQQKGFLSRKKVVQEPAVAEAAVSTFPDAHDTLSTRKSPVRPVPVKTTLAKFADFSDVASLRIDAFMFCADPPKRQRMQYLAKDKMIERKAQGATVIVAIGDSGEVCGSLELSYHEFLSTGVDRPRHTHHDREWTILEEAPAPGTMAYRLDRAKSPGGPAAEEGGFAFRPHGARLYVTEMCVGDGMRRRGVGLALLEAAEELARVDFVPPPPPTGPPPLAPQVSGQQPDAAAVAAAPLRPALYLHVDARNGAALRLYLRAGFQAVRETPETARFADGLGLRSGQNTKRTYLLMAKDV